MDYIFIRKSVHVHTFVRTSWYLVSTAPPHILRSRKRRRVPTVLPGLYVQTLGFTVIPRSFNLSCLRKLRNFTASCSTIELLRNDTHKRMKSYLCAFTIKRGLMAAPPLRIVQSLFLPLNLGVHIKERSFLKEQKWFYYNQDFQFSQRHARRDFVEMSLFSNKGK